jgi:hypothetical protein
VEEILLAQGLQHPRCDIVCQHWVLLFFDAILAGIAPGEFGRLAIAGGNPPPHLTYNTAARVIVLLYSYHRRRCVWDSLFADSRDFLWSVTPFKCYFTFYGQNGPTLSLSSVEMVW